MTCVDSLTTIVSKLDPLFFIKFFFSSEELISKHSKLIFWRSLSFNHNLKVIVHILIAWLKFANHLIGKLSMVLCQSIKILKFSFFFLLLDCRCRIPIINLILLGRNTIKHINDLLNFGKRKQEIIGFTSILLQFFFIFSELEWVICHQSDWFSYRLCKCAKNNVTTLIKLLWKVQTTTTTKKANTQTLWFKRRYFFVEILSRSKSDFAFGM